MTMSHMVHTRWVGALRRRSKQRWRGILGAGAATAGLLACTTTPLPPPATEGPTAASPAQKSRLQPVDWGALPGWPHDRLAELWPALQLGCIKPVPAWVRLCPQVLLAGRMDEAGLRAWMQANLQPMAVLPAEGNEPTGLLTGYFEPLMEGSRRPQGAFRHPLYRLPADLPRAQPWFSREQVDTRPDAQAALRGREIAYLADPLDVLLLQVQGSGRLRLLDEPGQPTVRLAYAGHNGHPYRSVGRWLIDQGELGATQANWPAIKEWARRNPQRQQPMLWANPRLVFFKEEPLPDPTQGPRGSLGLPLTAGRSVAVDPASIPLGSLLWLDSTEPLSNTPLQRAVLAQDTGSAILGAVRADYFWGTGAQAEAQAGRMKQALRLWVLVPR